jgi:hypothetical protein
MINNPIRIQLLALPEVRKNRTCEECVFYYHEFDYGDFCNLDFPLHESCKMNFILEEMKLLLDDIIKEENYMLRPLSFAPIKLMKLNDSGDYTYE